MTPNYIAINDKLESTKNHLLDLREMMLDSDEKYTIQDLYSYIDILIDQMVDITNLLLNIYGI